MRSTAAAHNLCASVGGDAHIVPPHHTSCNLSLRGRGQNWGRPPQGSAEILGTATGSSSPTEMQQDCGETGRRGRRPLHKVFIMSDCRGLCSSPPSAISSPQHFPPFFPQKGLTAAFFWHTINTLKDLSENSAGIFASYNVPVGKATAGIRTAAAKWWRHHKMV